MGEIFLAKIGEIEGFEKLVIIKKVLPNLVENEDFIARFVDEAQVAIKLNHANIAPVYEVGRVSGEYFLTIEYIEGRDLRKLAQRCRERHIRLPPDICLFMARELAAGLAYAHRRTDSKGTPLSLVHCDISPPNVMVSFEGEVKVIDFGIARSALRTAGSNPNMGFGKFGYMAPEQLLKGKVIDRRTDIYAAGVVLYEMITGERLYQFPEGADYRQIARTVCLGRFLPPSERDPSLDPSFDQVICRALATEKEDRYQNAEEFRDALQQKLYQLNPTFSTDTLSHFMLELFGAEREKERQELAEMRAMDVGAFQEELAGSATHTVTFARAQRKDPSLSLVASQRTPTPSLVPLDHSPREPSGQVTDPARPPPKGSIRLMAFGISAIALVIGVSMALYLRREDRAIANAHSTPKLALATKPTPVAEPLALDQTTQPLKPQPIVKPKSPSRTKPATKAEPPPLPILESPKLGPSPQSVESKFKQVGNEYAEFKRNFGARLEDRWHQILTEAALGKRDQHLDDMLNQLRRDMAKVQKGG